MPIYEKPTRELMHEFAAEELKPGQVFSRNDAVLWFADHYPDINRNTVRMHVDGMSVNSPKWTFPQVHQVAGTRERRLQAIL